MNDERDDKLMQAASRLATDIAPERDLWAGIAEAIEAPPKRRWTPMLAQAAAVTLLVGASSMITYLVMKDDRTTVPVQISNPDALFDQVSYSAPGFLEARATLVAELEMELAKLSEEDRQTIHTNLTLIHDAIADMNEALEAEPDNVLLQERLLKTYREELALLRRVGGLTRNVMLRNDI